MMIHRPQPPVHGAEREMLTGWLDFQRATLAIKCDGLDAASMRGTTGTRT